MPDGPQRPPAEPSASVGVASLPPAGGADGSRSRTWLIHVILPIGGSVALHVLVMTLLVLASWTVLAERAVVEAEYEVGIADGAGFAHEGGFDWPSQAEIESPQSELSSPSESWEFEQSPDFSDLGVPDPLSAAERAAGGGFGIGDSGRSGILGIGGGAGEGGGEGFGSGFGGGTSIGSAGVWQLSARGDEFAYVVDFSGSIIVAVDDLRRELKRSVGGLRPTQSFDVFVFYSTGDPRRERYQTEAFAPKLLSATAGSKRDFFAWIDSKSPQGRTEPLAAMKRALAQKPDAVFFFSDGLFDEKVVGQIAEANTARARIYCLVFDEVLLQDTSDLPRWTEGARRLKRIAEQSGGKAKVVTGADLGG